MSPPSRIDDPTVDQPPAALDGGPVAVELGDGTFDSSLLGGKGAALQRLVGRGLPVPSCGVVTTEAYRALVGDEELQRLIAAVARGDQVPSEEVDAAFLAAPLDAEVACAVVALAEAVGGGPGVLAVRSSATIEDLASSSFAGQYRSFLEVHSADGPAVLRAVRLVFASLWHPAPVAYRRALGVDASGAAMAAVLMRMVPALQAGVVFTVDPTRTSPAGERPARVELVAGLGESLVSGRRTPEIHVVARDAPSSDLPEVVSLALDLALEVERFEEVPQDVEWAWDGERVWVVQARPITTLQVGRDDIDDEPGALQGLDLTTAGIGEMLPGVLAPSTWSFAALLVEEAFRTLLAELGTLPADLVEPRGLVRRVHGRAALDYAKLREMVAVLPAEAGDELEAQYFGTLPERSAPPRRHRRSGWLGAPLHDLRVGAVRKRATFDAAVAAAAAERLAPAGRSAAAATAAPERRRALLTRLLRLVDLGQRAMTAEVAVAADAAADYRRLELLLARRLDDVVAARLAAALTARVAPPAPSGRSSAAVFAGPTWDELGLAAPVIAAPAPDRAAPDALAALHEALSAVEGRRVAGWRGRLFVRSVRRLVVETTAQLARRERTKAAVLRIGGEVRHVVLDAGALLVEHGVLGSPGDVELLSAPELVAALQRGATVAPAVLRRRRRALVRAAAEPPLPLRFSGVPAPHPPLVAEQHVTQLHGCAASEGRQRGRARVLRHPSEHFEADEVLVATATDPSWSPLFVRAGAIVLERGGPLSHAAILARELGVPAVLDVAAATELLDGKDVLVDGDHGMVTVIEDGGGTP